MDHSRVEVAGFTRVVAYDHASVLKRVVHRVGFLVKAVPSAHGYGIRDGGVGQKTKAIK